MRMRRRLVAALPPLAATAVAAACATFGASESSGSPDAAADADAAPSDEAATDAGMPPSGDAGADGDSLPFHCDAAADETPDAATCNGFPVDVTSDPHNCGVCGHDCAGASCAGGRCTSSIVFADPNEGGVPNGGGEVVGVSNGYVYWTYPGGGDIGFAVHRALLDGSSPSIVHDVASYDGPYASAVIGDMVYFIDAREQLFRVDASSTTPTETLVATFGSASFYPGSSLLAVGSTLYVTDANANVWTVALDAPLPVTAAPVAGAPAHAPRDLAAGTVTVGWVDEPWYDDPDAGGALRRIAAAASVPAVPFPQPCGLAFGGGAFWFYESQTTQLVDIGESSLGPASPFATLDAGRAGRRSAGTILDGTRAYVGVGTHGDSLSIHEVSLCSGASRVRYVSSEPVSGRLVAGSGSLYWAEYGGTVRRMVE